MIARMGYVDYFLITWDFIDYAKRRATAGRVSSGAGSIAPPLSITADPLQYNLLLSASEPGRMSMPI